MFFGLRSILYTEAEKREKPGRPGNTCHVNDVRWMQGRCRGGVNESQHNQLSVLRSNVSFALLNKIEVVPGQIHM